MGMNRESTIRVLVMEDDEELWRATRTSLQQDNRAREMLEKSRNLFSLLPSDAPPPVEEMTQEERAYELVWARTGQEGLEKLLEEQEKGETFDFVMVDKSMPPGWDGIETIERVREVMPDLTMALVTAYAIDEKTSEHLKSMTIHLLQKPYQATELREFIEEIVASPVPQGDC